MNTMSSETSSRKKSPRNEFDIDFDFDIQFGLTDYILMGLYFLIVLPIELMNRIISDCYTAFKERRAQKEEVMPVFLQ